MRWVRVPVAFIISLTCGFASSATIFYDDFSDGSVTNGMPLDRGGDPVTWRNYFSNISLPVEDGNLVLRTSFDHCARSNILVGFRDQ